MNYEFWMNCPRPAAFEDPQDRRAGAALLLLQTLNLFASCSSLRFSLPLLGFLHILSSSVMEWLT